MGQLWTDNQYPKFTYLREAGGSIDMNVDGSVVPVEFFYESPVDERFRISFLNIVMLDPLIRPDQFAGQPELTNGLLVEVIDQLNVVQQNFFEDFVGQTITRHIDFGLVAGVDVMVSDGAPIDGLLIRWTLEYATSKNLCELLPGHRIRIVVQDDLSAMVQFRAMVQGVVLTQF